MHACVRACMPVSTQARVRVHAMRVCTRVRMQLRFMHRFVAASRADEAAQAGEVAAEPNREATALVRSDLFIFDNFSEDADGERRGPVADLKVPQDADATLRHALAPSAFAVGNAPKRLLTIGPVAPVPRDRRPRRRRRARRPLAAARVARGSPPAIFFKQHFPSMPTAKAGDPWPI